MDGCEKRKVRGVDSFMKNLNYQGYLNEFILFNQILWDVTKNSIKNCRSHKICSTNKNIICDYQRLEWDTDLLGIVTGRINNIFFDKEPVFEEVAEFIEVIEQELQERGVKFVFVRLNLSHFHVWKAFELKNWLTADIINVYSANSSQSSFLDKNVKDESHLSVREPSLKESLCLFDSEKKLFSYSRIHRDPNIPLKKGIKFYRELLIHVFNKPHSVKTALYDGNDIIGLVLGESEKVFPDKADFSVGYLWEIFLASGYRGRGFSKLLLCKFMDKIRSNVDFIEIGTQMDNIPANRLYASGGLRLAAAGVTLHKWFT